MQDPAKLALVGEAQVLAAIELDRQVLESQPRINARNDAELAGHPQVDHQCRVVVEPEQEVLCPAVDIREAPAGEPGGDRVRRFCPDDAGKVPEPEADDLSVKHMSQQRPAHGLDFGQFWHTGNDLVATGLGCRSYHAGVME